MKTHEQLRDELAGVLLSTWAAKTYGTPHEIARASAQSIINTIAADMNEVREALEELVNNHGFYTEERFALAQQALAKLECWRKP